MALKNRTALITGSGRNIGRGCAKELAQAGFNIVLNGSSNRADCESDRTARARAAIALVASGARFSLFCLFWIIMRCSLAS